MNDKIGSLSKNLIFNSDNIWYAKGHKDFKFLEDDPTDWAFIEDHSFWYCHRRKVFLEAIWKYPPFGEVYEIGAGRGSISKALQDNFIESVAIEPTVYLAKYAKSRGCNHVICANIDNAGFGEKSFPNIGIFDVLEHIPDDDFFLTQLRRLIKNQGRVYCAVPAYNFLWSNEDSDAGHLRRYQMEDLCLKFEKSGFEIEYKTFYFQSLLIPIFLARTLPYFLGMRKKRSTKKTVREHVLRPSILFNIVNWLLDKELLAIASGDSLKFGASCFIVAKAS